MIYDCCIYNGEKKLLRMAIEEFKNLSPYKLTMPVTHVVVESEYTFTGIRKPLTFNKEDFPEENILYYPLGYAPHSPNTFDEGESMVGTPWDNETYQRNSIAMALLTQSLQDDDIVIIRDADEIPRSYAVQHYRPDFGLVALQMDQYYLYINALAERNQWNIPKIMSWRYLKDKTPDQVRRSGYDFALVKAGYHYSYLGNVDNLLKKFASFSHQEASVQRMADRDILQGKLDRLESIWGDNKLQVVNPEDMPYYVQTHLEEFKDLIYVP